MDSHVKQIQQGQKRYMMWPIGFRHGGNNINLSPFGQHPCKHPSWNRRGIYVSQSCWDYVVKHVEMSSFLNVRIPNILCYVRGSDVEKTRHFHMFYHIISTWPTNINTMSVPKQVLAGMPLWVSSINSRDDSVLHEILIMQLQELVCQIIWLGKNTLKAVILMSKANQDLGSSITSTPAETCHRFRLGFW